MDKGFRADPTKVDAITRMPPPTDVAGVQRLLGMAQYLAKFLPHLTDVTKPLRELTHKDVEWVWDKPQEDAFQKLQKAIMNTPVLRYYNLKEEATIQCNASQSGLGAALMQNGQPVAYASRAMTEAETQYAQIEKELLAIVFACDRFDLYIYGRDRVKVESDHQPLEAIMKKPRCPKTSSMYAPATAKILTQRHLQEGQAHAPDPAPPNLPEPQLPLPPTQDETPQLHRSTRQRTTPDWITIYVPL